MSQIPNDLQYLNNLVQPPSNNPFSTSGGRGSFDNLFNQPSNPRGAYSTWTPGSRPNPDSYVSGSNPYRGVSSLPSTRPGGNGAIGILRRGLSSDIQALQSAELYNHDREVVAANQLRQGINAIPGHLQQAGGDASKLLTDAAGQATALGDKQVSDFFNRSHDILGNLEDTSAMQASAAERGLSRDFDIKQKLAEKGFDEQGSPLTEAMKADRRNDLTYEEGQQKQEIATKLFSDFNSLRAQLSTQLESIGANILGGQRDLASLGSNLKSMAAQIMNGNAVTSEQLQLQGRTNLAQYLTQSRFSPVSWFSGLSALFNAAAAPGARGVQLG